MTQARRTKAIRWTSFSLLLGASALVACSTGDNKQGSAERVAEVRAALDANSAIPAKWTQLGGAPVVGNSTSNITAVSCVPTPKHPGLFTAYYQTFTNGAIVASDSFGAVFMPLNLFNRWLATRFQGAYNDENIFAILGLPTADAAPFKGAQSVRFERGQIVDFAGGVAVYGDIYARYLALQDLGTPDLGLPTADEADGPNHGRFQTFQGGEIDWFDATPALQNGWEIVGGPIREKWLAAGRGLDPFGYPVGAHTEVLDGNGTVIGVSQAFQYGSYYYEYGSSSQGVVGLSADVNSVYTLYGGPTGWKGSESLPMGFPVGHGAASPAGTQYQLFENGMIVTPQAALYPDKSPQAFANPKFYVGTMSGGGPDCFFCGHIDASWELDVSEVAPVAKNLFPGAEHPGLFWEGGTSIAADEHHTLPDFTPDLVLKARFLGGDADATSPDDTFGVKHPAEWTWNIDNLWGRFEAYEKRINADDGGDDFLTSQFEVASYLPYDRQDLLGSLWWSFENFPTPTLGPTMWEKTFCNADQTEFHWLDDLIYGTVYKTLAKPGNCFGMDLQAIYAWRGNANEVEPIYQYSNDSSVSLDINEKHGYQLGAEVVIPEVDAFTYGDMHNPDKQFNNGLLYQSRGEPSIVTLTSDYLFGDGHAVVATSYEIGACQDPYPAGTCGRIHVLNPNIPMGGPVADGDRRHDEVIQVSFDLNRYYYYDARTKITYSGTGTGTLSHNGRLYIVPFGQVARHPHTLSINPGQWIKDDALVLFGSSGELTQATDASGGTLFKAPVTGRPQWNDLQDTGLAMRLAPVSPSTGPGPVDFQIYAGTHLSGVTQTYQVSQVPTVATGTPFTVTVASTRQSSEFTIPGTLGKSDSVTASDINTDAGATTLQIAPDAVAKAVTWKISGPELFRWAEFSNLSMQPNQAIKMHAGNAGYSIGITNTGPQTSATLNVSRGRDQPTVNMGVVTIPTGTSTVDFSNAVPWDPNQYGLEAWYLAAPDQFTLVGNAVQVWKDKSNQGRDVTAPNSNARPQYVPGGWGAGKDTVHFSGGNLLSLANWTGAPAGTSAAFTVLAVVRPTLLGGQDAGLAGWWDPNGQGFAWAALKKSGGKEVPQLFRLGNTNIGQTWSGTQDLGSTADLTNTQHVVAWRYSATDQTEKITVDGVTSSSPTLAPIGAVPAMPFIIGAKNLLATGLFAGDVSELMVFQTALDENAVQTYTSNARTTWGGVPAQGNASPCVLADGGFASATTRCDDGNASTNGDHCSGSGACAGTASSANSPALVSSTPPLAWYYASPQEVDITDGGVSTWFDRTSNHRNLTQANYNGRPLLQATGWNNQRPVLAFGGARLLRNDGWSGSPTGTGNAFTVLAVLDVATPQNPLNLGSSGTSSVASWWSPNAYGTIQVGIKPSGSAMALDLLRSDDTRANQDLVGPTIAAGRHVVSWRFGANTLTINLDGNTPVSAPKPAIGSISPDSFLVGAATSLSSNLFNGSIAELAVIPALLTDTQVANFRNNYALSEWGGLP
jgi:hypothetical protein